MTVPGRGRSRVVALVVLALLALVAPACSEDDSATALRVDGWSLSTVDFTDTLNQIAANPGYLAAHGGAAGPLDPYTPGTRDYSPEFTAEFLNERVTFQLAAAEVARRKLQITDADRQKALEVVTQGLSPDPVPQGVDPQGQKVLDAFGSYRDVLLTGVTNLQALRRDLTKDVDRAVEARKLYDAAGENFSLQACVTQLVFKVGDGTNPDPSDADRAAARERAEAAAARIRGGEDPSAVAREVSDDPTSGPQGGDFGCVPRQTFDEAVENAVWTQPVGEVGDPIDDGATVRLVVVRDRRTFTFDELQPRLEALVEDQLNERLNTWVSDSARKASVWVNPRLGTWNAERGTVTPVGNTAKIGLTPGSDATSSSGATSSPGPAETTP